MDKIPKKQILTRNTIEQREHEDDAYARRVLAVDKDGNNYTLANPFPVQLSDGSISIGTVNAELEVQLSSRDNYPNSGDIHDSIRIGDQDYELALNPDGSINLVNTDGTSALDVRRDINENISYLGVAVPGSNASDPVWRITRTVYKHNNKTNQEDKTVLVASTGDFDQIWDNRVSLFPAETPVNFWDRKIERILSLLANAKWMANTSFDNITPDFSSNETAILSYMRSGTIIAKAFIKYNNDLDWKIDLERYVNQDSGDQLILDNGLPFLADA